MFDIESLDKQYYDENIAAVTSWCCKAYQDNFYDYFKIVEDLCNRFSSNDRPITDSELEQILIDVPLELIQASEKLTTFKTALETIKLALKKKRLDMIDDLKAESETKLTDSTAKKKAEEQTIEDEVLILAYQNLISKVESKISLTKELIMGAKKVFDRRKANEETMPVKPVNDSIEDLPEYSIPGSQYIKG